jgi:RNA polymerase sigma-70 factor (ECF subfamily)
MAKTEETAAAEQAFRQIFGRYYRPVYYFFVNRGLSEEECHDLTQETFLRVYKAIEGLRHSEKVRSWLLEIAGNLWKNELRRRSAQKRSGWEISLEEMVESGLPLPYDEWLAGRGCSRPLDEIMATEAFERLLMALKQLPPQMRRCFLLRFDQGLKYREIAAAMHLSIETVKSQLGQARQRLRSEVDSALVEGREVSSHD